MTEDGSVNKNALRLRLTDAYLDTLKKVYQEVKLVGLPRSGGGSGSEGGMSAEALATAIVLSNHIGGTAGGSGSTGDAGAAAAGNSQDVQALQRQISSLTDSLHQISSATTGKQARDSVHYLDNKILH